MTEEDIQQLEESNEKLRKEITELKQKRDKLNEPQFSFNVDDIKPISPIVNATYNGTVSFTSKKHLDSNDDTMVGYVSL